MKSMKDQRGSVLVFATLMIVLLLVMVGIGLDTGWITYMRGLGQPAVDAAALAGASALPTWNPADVNSRVAAFNATNDYVNSKSAQAQIQNDGTNVMFVVWDPVSGNIIKAANGIRDANGVRVALEEANPYGGNAPNTAINAPLFLTPLFNVLGISMAKTANINVSAVAVVQRIPAMPIALATCPPPGACQGMSQNGLTNEKCKIAQDPTNNFSGWTSFNQIPTASLISDMTKEPSICSGKIPAVEVGSKICLFPQGSGILDALKNYYLTNIDGLSEPDGLSNPHVADCGLVPVVASGANFNSYNNPCDVEIKSFARVCIRDVDTSSNPKFVYADITCNVSLYDPPDPSSKNCYIPRLVRDKKSSM